MTIGEARELAQEITDVLMELDRRRRKPRESEMSWRRFQPGDLVKYRGEVYLVSEEENDCGKVGIIKDNREFSLVLHWDVSLLLTAEETLELPEKGGLHD